MKTSTKSCCGLDLQKEYLSAVLYFADKRAATPIILKPFPLPADTAASPWSTWEGEIRSIKSQLKQYASSVICSIPADYAVIKVCALDADEEAAREVIEWELGQQIIGSVDDYLFDYEKKAAGAAEAVKKYLVAAYRKEYVQRLAGMVRKIGVEPHVIDLDLFGLVNAFEANYPEKTASPALLIHCETQMTKLVLTVEGAFIDYHCFEHTGGFMDPAAYGAALAAEIDRFLATPSLAGARAESGTYCTGSFLKQAENRATVLQEINGAELLNPFREIKCQLEDIEERQLLEHSTQLAVATGLSLRCEA
ncbi:MAG: pilus assembly protein PilM [Chitinispirillaceae bacterium]|nr:pilus assembly protein PilM [Chitinispirillaceae bacterium]